MKNIQYAGMDVHKETIQIALYDSGPGRDPILEKEILNDPPAIKRFFKGLGPEMEVHSCYEAGCLGYELHRFLSGIGVNNCIVAPAAIPRSTSQQVKKTDRTDARVLGQMLRSGQVSPLYTPTSEDEAVRDYLRLREDQKIELFHTRQRLQGFLLRHRLRYETGKQSWTNTHITWLRGLKLEISTLQKTLDLQIIRVDELTQRLDEMDKAILKMAASEPYAQRVKNLAGLKGIGLHTALSLIVEVGDFKRFANAPSFMSYLGLVPREHSSGPRRHLGGITKCGNTHLRTLLIESSWCYRFRSRVSKRLAARRADCSPALKVYFNKATKHLEDRYYELVTVAHKPSQVAVTAIARELAGYAWGVMVEKIA